MAQCAGAGAVATGHAYLDQGWKAEVGEPEAMEEDMLAFAYDVRPNSRLSCQIKVRDALDGLVVRGPEVQQIRIAALDAGQDPPTMTVDLIVKGARYVENRDTVAVVSGSRDRVVTFTEHWTLAIDGPAENPWRIVASGQPAPAPR